MILLLGKYFFLGEKTLKEVDLCQNLKILHTFLKKIATFLDLCVQKKMFGWNEIRLTDTLTENGVFEVHL